jgi:hypothetical protein
MIAVLDLDLRFSGCFSLNILLYKFPNAEYVVSNSETIVKGDLDVMHKAPLFAYFIVLVHYL